jgi:acyl-CoA-binding protein
MMLSNFLLLLFCLGTLALYAYVSSVDFDMEKQEFKEYCEMVKWGAWPDYKNLEQHCD